MTTDSPLRSTVRTIVGYCRAFLKRRLGMREGGNDLQAIYNYLDIESLYATSGQPTEEQFPLIKNAGYQTVINLAPTSMVENSVIDEAAILEKLGMTYVHIPVDFKNPKEHDFQLFVSALNDASEQKVWVHCAANMRVSALTYRYRCEVLGEPKVSAEAALHKIWQPMGVWKEYILLDRAE